MSFRRYPKYTNSGVEWLGEVPAHWGVMPLGYLCSRIGSGKTPAGGAEVYHSEGVVFLRSQNVHNEGLFLDDVVYIDAETDEELSGSRVQDGDVLLNITGASLGRTCLVPRGFPPANVNQHVCIIRLKETELRDFISLSMQSHYVGGQIGAEQSGAAREGLNFAQISKLRLAVPPKAEYAGIAAFLATEVSRIDELVAEQRVLIELLEEKRQAVILHAVTKGLNPDAPMKPSGVEWLGEVPAHWEIVHLNRLVDLNRRITYGIVQPGEFDVSGRFMVRGQDYSDGWAAPESLFKVSDSIETPYARARLTIGDLLITIVGAGVGNAAIVPDWLEGANITQTTARIAISGSLADPRFVMAVLQGPVGRRSVELFAKGAAQPGLNLEHLRIFPIPRPPLFEQSAIAEFLGNKLPRLDTLTQEAEAAVFLLGERRQALISAAVTGQIDVRHLVRAEAA